MQAFAVIIVIRGTRIMANFAGVQLHGTMRRMACITMMMAAIVTGLCACTEKTEITTDMNGSGATDNDNFQIRMTKSVPQPNIFRKQPSVCSYRTSTHRHFSEANVRL